MADGSASFEIRLQAIGGSVVGQLVADFDKLEKGAKDAGRGITVGLAEASRAAKGFEGVLGNTSRELAAFKSTGAGLKNLPIGLSGNFPGAVNGLNAVTSAAGVASKAVQAVGSAAPVDVAGIASVLVALQSIPDAAEKGTKSTAEGFNAMDLAAVTAGNSIKDISKAFGAAFALAKIADVTASFLGASVELDKVKRQIGTITGSLAESAREINRITQLSATLPFALEDITTSVVALKNEGLDASNEALRAYANIAVTADTTLEQVASAVDDAVDGRFPGLRAFGIEAEKEGEQIRLTFRDTTALIKNDAASIQGFLKELGNTAFFGATEEAIRGLSGQTARFNNELALLKAKSGEAGAGLAAWVVGKAADLASGLASVVPPARLADTTLQKIIETTRVFSEVSIKGNLEQETTESLVLYRKQLRAAKDFFFARRELAANEQLRLEAQLDHASSLSDPLGWVAPTAAQIQAFFTGRKSVLDAASKAFGEDTRTGVALEKQFALVDALVRKRAAAESAAADEQARKRTELTSLIETESTRAADLEKSLAADVAAKKAQYEQEALNKKLQSAQQGLQAQRSALQQALSEEQRYRARVIALRQEIVDVQRSGDEQVAARRRQALERQASEAEQAAGTARNQGAEEEAIRQEQRAAELRARVQADIQAQIRQRAQEAQAAIAQGNAAEADRLAQSVRSLGDQLTSDSAAIAAIQQGTALQVQAKQAEAVAAQKAAEAQRLAADTARAAIEEQTALVGALEAKLFALQELKPIVEAQVNIDAALANIAHLQLALDSIRPPNVGGFQVGGAVGGFAAGGHLPGYGGGDRRLIMAEDGEFVLRKEAVRRYGLGFVSAINSLRANLPKFHAGGAVDAVRAMRFQAPLLPPLPPIPRFARGGAVFSSPAPAGETVRLELAIGGGSFDLFGQRDQVRGLVRALKEAGRGL